MEKIERICNTSHAPKHLLRFRNLEGQPKMSVLVCDDCIDTPYFVKLQGRCKKEPIANTS